MSNLLDRWRKAELDTALAVYQLVTFLVALALVICSALLYRHFTEDALIEFWGYLGSVKLAAPPLVVLSATYFYAFVTGGSIADAPKNIWKWLRNEALQERTFMSRFIVIGLLSCLASLSILQFRTPPAYEHLVAQLLGGENDDHEVISESIKRLKDKNPKLAQRLDVVRQVFDERRHWNHENKTPNPALPRVFIRALEANIDDNDWQTHPLRWHAAAEAYVMLAQAIATRPGSTSAKVVSDDRDAAIALYGKVASSHDNRVTELMRKSAVQNIGNAYYYAGNYAEALREYDNVSSQQRSLSVDANRVATLVQLRKFEDAIREGEDARRTAFSGGKLLTELRDYVALVTNIGFSRLIVGQVNKAKEDMQEIFDLLPDAMARQNLALALVASGESAAALKLLSEDIEAPVVTPSSELEVVAKRGGGSCTYLIRGIALLAVKLDPDEASANFAAYARQPQPQEHLSGDTSRWRNVALKTLQEEQRPCGGLQLLGFVMNPLQ